MSITLRYSFYISVNYEQGKRHLKRSFTKTNVYTGTEAEDESDATELILDEREPTILSKDDARTELARIQSNNYYQIYVRFLFLYSAVKNITILKMSMVMFYLSFR